MLRRHSNPTKNKVWWPRQTKLLVGFGLRFLRVFMGLDEFLQVLGGFFLRIVAKLLHQRFCWLKFAFLAKTNSKQGFDSSTRVFQGFGWCRIYDDIKLWQVLISTVIADQDFIYIFKIYIEFRSFGGICCGGILTLQKTRFGGPGKPSFWSVLDYGFYGFLWVWMSFCRFATVFFRGLWRSCFIKNLVLLTKTYFFLAETNSKQGFDSSTRVFQGFGWCRVYDNDIKLW